MNIYGIVETHIVDDKLVGERLLNNFYKTRDSAKAKGLSVIKKLRENEGFEVEAFENIGRMVMRKDETVFIYHVHCKRLED